MMRMTEAARETIHATAGSHEAERDDAGKTKKHAMWMLRGIMEGYIQHEKAHRWLGYAQGMLVCQGALILEDVECINREASS